MAGRGIKAWILFRVGYLVVIVMGISLVLRSLGLLLAVGWLVLMKITPPPSEGGYPTVTFNDGTTMNLGEMRAEDLERAAKEAEADADALKYRRSAEFLRRSS
jgi:hypothetical protein